MVGRKHLKVNLLGRPRALSKQKHTHADIAEEPVLQSGRIYNYFVNQGLEHL